MSLEELRKALKNEKIQYGSTAAIKGLKTGTIHTIFLSQNCPANLKQDILHYSKLAKTTIYELKQPSDELSLICKKGFPVNVVSY